MTPPKQGLLKNLHGSLSLFAQIADILLFTTCALLSFYGYVAKFGKPLNNNYFFIIIIGALLLVPIGKRFEIYQSVRGKQLFIHIGRLLGTIVTVLTLLTVLIFFMHEANGFSRIWFICWGISSTIVLSLFRICLMKFLHYCRRHGRNQKHIVLIGAGIQGKLIAERIKAATWTGFQISHIWDDMISQQNQVINGIQVTAPPEDFNHFFNQTSPQEIWISLPLSAEKRLHDIINQLQQHTMAIRYFPDLLSFDLLRHSVSDVLGFSTLNLKASPMEEGANRLLKATEDYVLGSLILLFISPLMLIIAALIKLTSPGPIFYRQERLGWNGKPFQIYKFRSMPVDIEKESGPTRATPGENRATPLGTFLRKTSLDELPQFINVLKGEMSIVGPRPERPFFVEQLRYELKGYMQKHMVKAGISGWAQINGWRGLTSLEKRLEYDLYYINHWSLTLDLKIILISIFKGFINKNAH